MTEDQKQALANALRAETDAGIVLKMSKRDDVGLAAWCNTASAINAWNSNLSKIDMFEAIDGTKFDALVDKKRSSWEFLVGHCPIDSTRNKIRAWIKDVWGATDAPAVMANCTRKANHAEAYLGGNSATESGVTALKLNWSGTLSHGEISDILNKYPG